MVVLLSGLGLLKHFSHVDSFVWVIAKFFVLLMLAIWPIYLYGAKKKLPLLGSAAVLTGMVAAFFALYKPF